MTKSPPQVSAAPTAVAPPTETHEFFDSYSKSYDLVYGLMSYRKLLWDSFESLDLKSGMRVLDAGCGTGNFEQFISEKSHPPIVVDAIDFSAGMLALAAQKCAHLDHVTFSEADLSGRLAFDDDTFDRIVSINVLYAVPDWRATIRELLRVLKPGGRLIVTSTKVGWSYGPILTDHFSRVRNVWGLSRKMSALATPLRWFSPKGVGSFVSNVLVQDRLEREGKFPSFSEDELRQFFEAELSLGCVEAYEVRAVFCGQNLMGSAVKGATNPQP